MSDDNTAQPPEEALQREGAADGTPVLQQKAQRRTVSGRILAVVLGAAATVVVGVIGQSLDPSLEIIAAAVPTTIGMSVDQPPDSDLLGLQAWKVAGVVRDGGQPATDISVSAVATDVTGNRFASQMTTESGNFELVLLQEYAGGQRPKIDSIEVTAALATWLGITQTAATVLRPEATGGTRWTIASVAPFIAAISIFVVSILVSIFHSSDPRWMQAKYLTSVVLTVLFTGAMIYFIATTSRELGGSSDRFEVTSLGFAHVFFGSYSPTTEADWLMSLTTPSLTTPSLDQQPQGLQPQGLPPRQVVVSRGFGAPLWVLLLSVIGAALYTIKLVVGASIGQRNFEISITNLSVTKIVHHQFYILFAPIGAIFVYQLLVIAGGVSEPITVGLAALASGIALNAVLERAWRAVSGLMADKEAERAGRRQAASDEQET